MTRLARWFPTLLAAALALCAAGARAEAVSSLYVFGDSLTDEGRLGRTAPIMWPDALRTLMSIRRGRNLAIGGATTSDQPSAVFGDSSFLGQVKAFVGARPAIEPDAAAAIWIGTNNISIGAAHHLGPEIIARDAGADVETGIRLLVGAGLHDIVLLGTYDLSLTNAYEFAQADTPAVRAAAASASRLFNARLASLRVSGATIRYVDIADFINTLQSNPGVFGFQQILPLHAGARCGVVCQQTSIFDDTIHLSAKTQTLIGTYIASANPLYASTPVSYGAVAERMMGGGNAIAPVFAR